MNTFFLDFAISLHSSSVALSTISSDRSEAIGNLSPYILNRPIGIYVIL